MNLAISVNQKQLMEGLLDVAPVWSVFIWGAPGIGKSSIVEQFAAAVGLPCVSLFGSQLVPEDIIGVPRIVEGRSEFCPPRSIARDEPYCLFLDELNACSQEVQKAFYSLILERRVGEYRMPEEPIVVAAGNRAQDSAITRPMSSALLNRMIHVELTSDSRVWLEWAAGHGIRPYVYDYICARPDQLWSQPPKTEEPFSTPRSCLMLSDALNRGLLQGGEPEAGYRARRAGRRNPRPGPTPHSLGRGAGAGGVLRRRALRPGLHGSGGHRLGGPGSGAGRHPPPVWDRPAGGCRGLSKGRTASDHRRRLL